MQLEADPALNYTDLDAYVKDGVRNDLKSKVFMDNAHLRLSYTLWFELFSVVLKPIAGQVRTLMRKHKDLFGKSLKYIVLVGGLSESKYVKWYIKVKRPLLSFPSLFLHPPTK